MARYKVWNGATGGATGADWANAFTTLAAGIAAATALWDIVEVADDHIDLIAAVTTYVPVNNIAVVCVNRTTGALSEMNGTTGYIGSASSYSIKWSGAYSLYIYGLAEKCSSASTYTFAFGDSTAADGFAAIVQKCKFLFGGSASACRLVVGYSSGAQNINVNFVDCTVKFSAAGHGIALYGTAKFEGLTVDSSGVSPTSLVPVGMYGSEASFDRCNLAHCSGALLGNMTSRAVSLTFSDCALHADVTPLLTQTLTSTASGEVSLYNCTKGTQKGFFGHYNPLGSTELNTTVYANDGLTYDGTNRASWKITTTAYASFFTPYLSPWMERFCPVTSAITPYVEVLRDGSTTAFQDNGFAAEVIYPGGAENDCMAVLGTAANQTTSSKTASDWTGDSGTVWCGKLDSGSAVTPSSVGALRMRVRAMVPSETLYVDTQIRGVA